MEFDIVKLVVGLGNPGDQYAGTRHNIGWMVLDRMADRAGLAGRGRKRDASLVLELRTKGLELALAKPQTYMNDSGIAVRKLLASYHVPLVDLLVVTDDFSLPFGKLRFREGGTHGGHNGLRSVVDELGTEKVEGYGSGSGTPRGARSTTCSRRSRSTRRRGCRSCSTRRRMPSRRGRGTGPRRRRTGSTASSSRLRPTRRRRRRPQGGEVGGPADDNGIRRTKTGWRRILPGDPDDDAGSKGSKGSKGTKGR